jgi:hypothetical protein
MVDENGRQTITNDGATVMKVAMLCLTECIHHLILIAPRHRSPRRPHPDRHRPLPRRRGWRRHNIRRCACRRDTEGDQGLCRAGCQQPDHHQGPAESIEPCSKQDHGDRGRHSGGQPKGYPTEARRHGHEQQAHSPKLKVLHQDGRGCGPLAGPGRAEREAHRRQEDHRWRAPGLAFRQRC